MIERILEADRHLQVDQVAKARDIYARVVDLDPGNAIAVVGLARCALADGDDAEAYELASRALTMDPENDMARRMEARLAEVLATRGETVERPEAAASPPARQMRPVVTEDAPAPAGADTAPASPGGANDAVRVPSPAARAEVPAARPEARAARPAVRRSFFSRLLGR